MYDCTVYSVPGVSVHINLSICLYIYLYINLSIYLYFIYLNDCVAVVQCIKSASEMVWISYFCTRRYIESVYSVTMGRPVDVNIFVAICLSRPSTLSTGALWRPSAVHRTHHKHWTPGLFHPPQARRLSQATSWSHLNLIEKTHISLVYPRTTLNKRNDIVAKCRHRDKVLLKHRRFFPHAYQRSTAKFIRPPL